MRSVAGVHAQTCRVMLTLCSGQKIQSSVERMFRIWRERKVYDKVFVRQLELLLSGQPSTTGEAWGKASPRELCV